MRPYTDNFKAEEGAQKLPPLPVGAYVGKILGVKLDFNGNDQVITLQIDVAEGEYKDYYRRQYESQKGGRFEPKYKGTYRLTAPGQDSKYYDAQDRSFRTGIWALENSNPGFVWAWDENALKGKQVGFVVRERDWEMNGSFGTTTEIGTLTSVDKVRKGTAPTLKRRELKKKADLPAGAPAGSQYVEVDDEPFPFD